MALKTVQDSSLTAVANAIRVKAEIEGTLEFPTEFVSAIQSIPTGGGSVSVSPKEVNFYDYDGTVVDAYTASEFASLSAMPSNPKHKGLTAQGWNWSLADAQAYVAEYGRLNIGQMYVTTSGDTEIDIQLGIGRNKPYLCICPKGTVDIDWGDGSAHDSLYGNSVYTQKFIQHIYPDTGEMFTIKLHMESGNFTIRGDFSKGSLLLSDSDSTHTNVLYAYQNAVKAVRLGTSIGSGSFNSLKKCSSLETITIPNNLNFSPDCTDCYSLKSAILQKGLTYINADAFRNCYSLTSLSIPESVTSIGGDAFRECYSLPSVAIPTSAIHATNASNLFNKCYSLSSAVIPAEETSISSDFTNCRSLTALLIPENVTTIGGYSFSGCYSLKTLTFKPTTPPTAGTSAFDGLPSDLVVYVPAGTLSAYQSASNYSIIASYMVEMAA